MKTIPIQHEGDSYQAAEVDEHKIVLIKIAFGNHEYLEIEKLPSGSVVFRIINAEQQDVHHHDWEEHEGALPLTYEYPETGRMTMEVVGKSAKVLSEWMEKNLEGAE